MASDTSSSARSTGDIEEGKFTVERKSKCGKDSLAKSLRRKVLSRVFSEDYESDVAGGRLIFNPRGTIIQTWSKILFAASLTSLFIDPLFFLLPQVKANLCIHFPANLDIAFTAIRSLSDAVYVVHIFVRFRTAYVAPSSRVFGRGELVLVPEKISSRYLRRDFWLDIFAAQPLPQVLIWVVIPSLRGSSMAHTKLVIRICIIFQYLLRLYLIFPLSARIIKTTGLVLEKPWAGAAYNLLLYMLASHVFGCLWYLLAIERQHDCWRKVCSLPEVECYYPFMDCGRISSSASSNISILCNPNSGFYQFGIYRDALSSEVGSSSFFKKFFFCLWWAFRNLSSMGQGLSTSTYLGEIIYAMILGIVSLVLFGLLIGNMQRYLQTINARLEQWRTSKTDTEQWMHHRRLPHEMRESVRKYNQHKWCSTRGVDEEAILKNLPMVLRRTIKRHICIDLIRKVQLFNMMDEQILDAICERLKLSLYDQGSCIIREGDPVNEMLFVVRGHLNSDTTNGGQANFYNSCIVSPGDFCGEELVTWALDPRSTSSTALPSSTRTAVAITDIEAFSLPAEDLKFVASQFRRLNSKRVRHVFKFHSPLWRTWAACSIQAAWFRYRKKKEEAELHRRSSISGLQTEKNESSLFEVACNFTNYASKLAASTRRGGSKPQEPDFSIQD